MRVNIYNEELTGEVSVVSKVAEKTGIEYYGVRIWLKSPPELHVPNEGNNFADDDRSAVTLWFGDRAVCHDVARILAGRLSAAEERSRRDEAATGPMPSEELIGAWKLDDGTWLHVARTTGN